MSAGSGPPGRSIGWYRWLGLAAFAAAVASFLAAAVAELSSPGSPSNRPLFWTAVAVNLFCLVTLPTLLIRAIRFRGLATQQWRAVMMRAVWGGPFGTLGALWDLCTDPADAGASGRPDPRSGSQDGTR
ncbi:MAG: hypothetical protein KBF21_13180 [Thermoanaerobaculia bacterium]|jgi:hypothetical protein|nr:hypothetical protein [Thermoanaerobaculia bacterium]MBP9825172.1 hypothetical protein [Thermoanaerobaculia bacterium]